MQLFPCDQQDKISTESIQTHLWLDAQSDTSREVKNIIKFKLIFEENPVPFTSFEGVLKILFSPV